MKLGSATSLPKNKLHGQWRTRLLRLLPPTTAQRLTQLALRRGWGLPRRPLPELQHFPLRVELRGVGELLHPIGLAAGFDTDATCLQALPRLGFAFLEIGTVTPLAQRTRTRPRIVRLPQQFGLLDRNACANDGMEAVAARLQALRWDVSSVPLAVNIGSNRRTIAAGAVYDYLKGIATFRELAHFIVLNVSASQQVGLRSPADRDFIKTIAAETDTEVLPQLWLKLDPDMERRTFQALVACVAEHGFGGLVLTDTRRVLRPYAGGQSGHSLALPAVARLEQAYQVVRGELPLVASGGILSGSDVVQRIMRGASAVEIYTAFVYYGAGVVAKLLREMVAELQLLGFPSAMAAKDAYWQ